MLKIRERSLLFRWAYLLTDKKLPGRTDVCTLFWRSAVLTPVCVFFLLVIVGWACFVLLIGLWWAFRGIHWLGPVWGSIATVVLSWLILALLDKFRNGDTTTLNAVSLVAERVISAKRRYCHYVEVI